MTHETELDHLKDPVNTTDFFETVLVAYLQANPALESLMVDNLQGYMPAKNYPKLKASMIKHPRLKIFKQDSFSFGVAKGQLAKDEALILAFAQKVVLDPAVVKAHRAVEFDEAVERFTEVLTRMEEIVEGRQQIHVNEDAWEYRIWKLDQGFQEWDNFQKVYDRFTHEQADDLDRKKSIANVFCQYLKLTRNAAVLLSGKEAAAYKDELEIFWDTKRRDLHTAIITKLKNENPDFTENLKAIQSEYDALKSIHDKVTPAIKKATQKKFTDPTVRELPASYTAITANEADGLAKAKILLDDYTKHDSRLSRIVHFHWNRHHTKEVNRIVLRINSQGKDGINTMDELKSALEGIKLSNLNGSLARRIQFIKTHCHASNTNDAAQSERLVSQNI